MTKINILTQPYAEVYYVEDYKVGVILWKSGKIKSDEYRKAFNTIIDFFKNNKQYSFLNFLSDTRDQGVVSPAERKWFQGYIMDEAKKLGLKRGAVVIPKNVFKKYYLNLILATGAVFKIKIKIFDDKDDAQKWLIAFGDYKN